MADYTVVLLVEQALSAADAQQVRSLHESLEDPVRYVVLHPVEDASVRIESAMGTLGTSGDLLSTGPMLEESDVASMEKDLLEGAKGDLAASIAALEAAGGTATGKLISVDPVDGLVAEVKESAAAEVIILTNPHLVSEFFHLDWTSRARRKVGVPILHLLEHETFDEQAGSGEGVTGL
jgi:hypothetical protein